MDESLMPFFWLGLALPVLLLLQRWIHRHLRGLAYLVTGRMSWAVIIYAIILLPGVVLHELSHFLVARLLGVRTGNISFLPKLQDDGSVRLGYVEYYKHRSLDPVRESLVGAAPLITGSAVVLLIGFQIFDLEGLSLAIGAGNVDRLTDALSQLFTTPDFFVWLYLVFAISNAMMPSPSDRRAWPFFILVLAVLGVSLYLMDLRDVLVGGITGPVATVFGYLALAFSLAIGADLAFIFVIYAIEGVVSRLKGVELVYDQSRSPSPN